jgi:hypothetical protein
VLALSRIDHLEPIPVAERLRRFLRDRANQQFLAAVAVQGISVSAITAALWLAILSSLKNDP